MKPHYLFARLIRSTVVLSLLIHVGLAPIVGVPSPQRLPEAVEATSLEIPHPPSIPSLSAQSVPLAFQSPLPAPEGPERKKHPQLRPPLFPCHLRRPLPFSQGKRCIWPRAG